MLDLIQHLGHASSPQEAVQFLKAKGLLIDKTREVLISKKQLREHIYVDEFGKKIRKSVKYNDGSWRQFKWSGQNWAPGVKGVQNPPYGLDRLLNEPADKLCFIFEGEKDVERAWAAGLSATCNSGGASARNNEHSEWLTNRRICIVPDNDEAGTQHAKSVERSLKKLGIECFIFWECCSTLPKKGDFSDWMELNNNDVDRFVALANEASKKPRKN